MASLELLEPSASFWVQFFFFAPLNVSEQVHVIERCLFHKYGVRKGDTVAIYASNSLDYPVIYHAFLSLGAIITQGSPRSKEIEMKYHLENSGLYNSYPFVTVGRC